MPKEIEFWKQYEQEYYYQEDVLYESWQFT